MSTTALRQYSHFFSTLHDGSVVGDLGRGTHYSVLRAVLSDFRFHDFAVVWDEDHDARVIWCAEQLLRRGVLEKALALGERKGGLSVLTQTTPTAGLLSVVEEVCANVPWGSGEDAFSSDVCKFGDADSAIINDDDHRVVAYLAGIDALWELGAKPSQPPARLGGGMLARMRALDVKKKQP